MQQFDVFIPAASGEISGHKHYPLLLEKAQVDNKALIELGGMTMVSHVIQALDNSKYIRSITILGLQPEDIEVETKVPITFLEGGKTSFETIEIAMDYFQNRDDTTDYVISVSSDIPLLTSEMIDSMIESVDFSMDLEVYFHISSEKMTKLRYPNAKKLPIKIRGGNIFAGDFHILRPDVIEKRKKDLRQLMYNRKSVFAAIKIVSLRYIFKYLFRRLSIDDIRSRFKKIYDLDGAFILTDFPEPCLDLDYADDLEFFNHWVTSKRHDLQGDRSHAIRSYKEFHIAMNQPEIN